MTLEGMMNGLSVIFWALVGIYAYPIAFLTGMTTIVSLLTLTYAGTAWKKRHPAKVGEAEPLYPYMHGVAVIWTYAMVWGYRALLSCTKYHNQKPWFDTSEPLLILSGHMGQLGTPKMAEVCHLEIKLPMAAAAKRYYQGSSLGNAAEKTDTFVYVDQGGGRNAAKDGASRAMRMLVPGTAIVILPEGHRPSLKWIKESITKYPEYADHLVESLHWRPGLIQSLVDEYNKPLKALVFYPVLRRRLWGGSALKEFLLIPHIFCNWLHVLWEEELVTFKPHDIEGTKKTLFKLSQNYEAFIAKVRRQGKKRRFLFW